ncbi:hypothetical protein Tco_0204815, partial [Tanacetum coccineum]
NTMAEQNVPAQPPTRTDEQIVPRSQWLTIGKSNLLLKFRWPEANCSQLNSYKKLMEQFGTTLLHALYLQQFWKTMSYNEKTRVYSCQLDEQWFDLSADLLRNALAITLVKPTHPFELPPMVTQTKTPSSANAVGNRHPKFLFDHAELIWEEFPKGILTYFSHSQLKNPKKKANSSPHPLCLSLKVRQLKCFGMGKSPDPLITESHSTIHLIIQLSRKIGLLRITKKNSSRKCKEKGEGDGDDADLGGERAISLAIDPALLPQERTEYASTVSNPEKVSSGLRLTTLSPEDDRLDQIWKITCALAGPKPLSTWMMKSLQQLYRNKVHEKPEVHNRRTCPNDIQKVIMALWKRKLDDALLKISSRIRNLNRLGKESYKCQKGTEDEERTRFQLLQIRFSTDKVDLEEFDLKSALFSHMNKKKSANKNPTKLPSIPCSTWKL